MKVINISKDLNLVLDTKRTRTGFKHVAQLVERNHETIEASINYVNRTWERFEYESVIKKVLEKSNYLKGAQEVIMNKIVSEL